MFRVLLTEDHNVVRNGIKFLLDKESDLHVIAEATDAQQTLDLLEEGLQADIVLADINMTGINGIEMTVRIKKKFPGLKVIILSMLDNEKYIAEAFKAGACGYILKNVTAAELVFAIKHISTTNERYICREIALRLLDRLINKPDIVDELLDIELSKREIEVLALIAEGYTNIEIANKLYTSKRTVEGHRQNLIDKTGSRNTAALIRYAILSGLIN